MHRRNSVPRLLLAATLVLFLVPAPAPAEEPLISLSERIGMLEVQDEQPLVQVFASGRLLVHRPSHWTRPGDFETVLSVQDLEALIVELLDRDLGSIDATRLARAKAEASADDTKALAIHVSDPNEITLALNISGVAGRASVRREVRHLGLRADALAFPEIDELQNLLAATNRLRALTSTRGLRPVK